MIHDVDMFSHFAISSGISIMVVASEERYIYKTNNSTVFV